MNLLFTNVGRRTYLVDFALELRKKGYPVRLFVSDVSKHTAGFWVANEVTHFLTPRVDNDEKEYAEILLRRCKRYNIDVIIPLMDFELPVLAARKRLFKNKGIEIIVSEPEAINNCLNKKKNYYFCLEHDISVPKSYFSPDGIRGKFPLIKKKILGSGSAGLDKIENKNDLDNFIHNEDMVQEYIHGKEFGMNILNDLDGNFMHATFCEKILMRAGETDKAIGVFSQRFMRLARKISSEYRHVGNMDVDFIVDKNDKVYCIDFNPRFGGLYPIAHFSGFNYLKYILDMTQSKKVKISSRKKKVAFMKGISLHHFQG